MNFLKYLKTREWIFTAIIIVLIVGQVWLDLKLPNYMTKITQLVEMGVDNTTDIWIAGGKMLACALGSAVMAVIVGYCCAKLAATVAQRMRADVFDKVQSFGMNEIKKFSVPSLITRSTNDITQIQLTVAMGLQVIVKAPVMAIWAIVTILGKSWEWSLATAVAVIVLMLLIAFIVIFALPRFRKIQTLTDNVNRVTRENLTGLRVVRAYNAEAFESKKFEKANQELTGTNLVVNRLMAILSPGMQLMVSGLSLAIYWIGAYLINAADVANRLVLFSDMVVFMSYSMLIVMSFVMLTMIFIMLPRAVVSAKRIGEVLNTKPSIIDGKGDVAPTEQGTVEFKNVSFKYPNADEYVLKDISFKVNKGDTVAFIGSTGSGKSTLINLVPRFYDVTDGEVLVDGVNVKDYKQADLLNKIGYVSQKAVLFSGTVRSNICYGNNGKPEPTDDEINNALSISQASFVSKMPDGLDSHIAQGGTNVSGGQKQRLSIARAIARKPEICIFDDSFSALDYRTDKKLRDALRKKNKGVTNLIVAQRIGTIKDADTIVVLDNGTMAGCGKHEDLLKNCKVYKEIALSQLTEEELGNE